MSLSQQELFDQIRRDGPVRSWAAAATISSSDTTLRTVIPWGPHS
jgi:hypothetical protein